MASFAIRIPNFFGINDLKYRNQKDFRFATVSTNNSSQSFVLGKGEIPIFYKAPQACFLRKVSIDADCDGELGDLNQKLVGINGLNYRTQNDLRFAIVSADNLEFGPILRTKQGGNSGFLQVSPSIRFEKSFNRCGLRWRALQFESQTYWNQ